VRKAAAIVVLVFAGCSQALPGGEVAPTASVITTTAAEHSSTTTSLSPTTTSPQAPTTAIGMAAPRRCRPNPFPAEVADSLAADHPGAQLTAHVHDLRTGCSYSLNPENRQRTASVFKVMVMAGTLLEAQEADREVTAWEMGQMTPMITRSTNPPVRALWRSFGAGSWFTRQTEIFGLEQTTVQGEDGVTPWGRTGTSAHDQVDLLRQVLLGEWGPLDDESRATAVELMTAVVPSQTWGITAGVPDDWTVAQKNGFAGSIINSVGWVDEPGPSPGYVAAILTEGWGSHPEGIAVVERISGMIARAMLLPEPDSARTANAE
jgi:beta-lactamase class A